MCVGVTDGSAGRLSADVARESGFVLQKHIPELYTLHTSSIHRLRNPAHKLRPRSRVKGRGYNTHGRSETPFLTMYGRSHFSAIMGHVLIVLICARNN